MEIMDRLKYFLIVIIIINPVYAVVEQENTIICYTKLASNDVVFELSPCKVAAQQGEEDALFSLGFGKTNSFRAKDNELKSKLTYTKVSKLGHPHRSKSSVDIDNDYVIRVFTESAELGDPKAQYNLGLTYNEGKRAVKNNILAFQWYQKSAMQGYRKAQYNIGHMYANGQGVDQDPVEAYAWWDVAVTQGFDAGIRNIAIVLKVMSESQIQAAKNLSKKYHAKYIQSH